MSELFGSDAFSPREVAARVEAVGVAKARLPLRSMLLLGMLAGAFIGLGALYAVIVASDPSLGFAASRLLGGLAFSLGLLLVVVAGAELFTGNNLLAMAWADGRITTRELLRNWRVLCNVLVCAAVWMAMAGRSVIDKAVAIVFPISAFVAAGFEHSVANMYLIPLGALLQSTGTVVPGVADITLLGMLGNLVSVILGNLIGGSVLVGLVYYLIYVRGEPAA